MTTAPPEAVAFVARQLGVDPGVLGGHGVRAQTRTDHVNQVKVHLGFPLADGWGLGGGSGLVGW